MKIFWFDTETGGVDRKNCALLTLSGWIEIDGERVEEIKLQFRPQEGTIVEDGALQVNGLTREQIAAFPPASEGIAKLKAIFKKYVDPFKKDKPEFYKLILAGYNVGFDQEILEETFKRNGDKYFWSWFDYHKFDVLQLAMTLVISGIIKPKGFKLVNMAEYLEIAMDKAHEASCDIETTKIVFNRLVERIKVTHEV